MKEQFAQAWEGFAGTAWKEGVNVRDFLLANVTPYEGDEHFLVAEPATSTRALWDRVMEGIKQENATHAPLDFDTSLVSSITAHDAGYIDASLETIVGLQTEAPLKRAIMPMVGSRWWKGPVRPTAASWIRR